MNLWSERLAVTSCLSSVSMTLTQSPLSECINISHITRFDYQLQKVIIIFPQSERFYKIHVLHGSSGTLWKKLEPTDKVLCKVLIYLSNTEAVMHTLPSVTGTDVYLRT